MRVNKEQDASEQMESLNVEVDALIEARQLSLEELENSLPRYVWSHVQTLLLPLR